MNDAIKNIPWYIEGSECFMWRVDPNDYVGVENPRRVYLRLDDVLQLLEGRDTIRKEIENML